MEDKIRITTETGSRLVGALIGLVRATDGMMHVTDDTNNIIIEGLLMSDIALGISDADMKAMIARVHADKHTIVPDCSVCGAHHVAGLQIMTGRACTEKNGQSTRKAIEMAMWQSLLSYRTCG